MSILDPLTAADFPLVANGQFVYRRTSSSPFIGPVSMHLAADLAFRLNRDGMPSAVPPKWGGPMPLEGCNYILKVPTP
jgi:hypothetical protein